MRKISVITPDDPDYNILKHREDVIVVSPEQMEIMFQKACECGNFNFFNRGISKCVSRKKRKRK